MIINKEYDDVAFHRVIENFLDAREGTEAFEWTPPNESYTSKYRCKTWSKTMPYSNLATIKATFEEVALP